jgi:GTP cyclohydrolase I
MDNAVMVYSSNHYHLGPGTRQRKESTPEETEQRLEKMSGAVRTILECIGEDPEREGLRETPLRYAKAMLYFTKGYEENVRDLVNNAVFHEDHDELVIVKDIDVFSMCEHHMVPFTGKVRIVGYIDTVVIIILTTYRCISDTSLIAASLVCQNWLAWQRCSLADSRSRSVLPSKSRWQSQRSSSLAASVSSWNLPTFAWLCAACRRLAAPPLPAVCWDACVPAPRLVKSS